ncbi:MAG TPA: hypothetical protein VN843_06890, partial [Anaerolineales bacterium]|nr:hypothetical protein [Anaerolineales bacterium]
MNKKIQNAAFKFMDVIMILTMVLTGPMNVAAAPLAQDPTPVLGTDASDYAPGATAHITGSGFAPGDYTLAALGPDSAVVEWGSVTADGDGNFAADSPELTSAGNYEVSAFAGDNALVATVSFTVTAPPDPTQPPTAEPTQEPTTEPTQEPTATEPPTATSEPTSEP